MLHPGGGHVANAHAFLPPRVAARQQGGLADPQFALVLGFNRVEDDDWKLPALKTMRSTDLGQQTPIEFHITQCLQGGLCLDGIGGDHSRGLLVPIMQFDQRPGQQQSRGPPARAGAHSPDMGELAQTVGVNEDDLRVGGIVGADVVACLEQPLVREQVGEPHDVRPEAVLRVEHQAGRMANRVGRGADAAVPERVRDKPVPDIWPIAVFDTARQDRAELHEVTEQHRALRCFGHRQQHLGQTSGADLVYEDHVVRPVESCLD